MLLIPPPFYFLSLLKTHHKCEAAGQRQFLTCSPRHCQRGGKALRCCPAVLAVPAARGLEGCSQDQPEHRRAIKHPLLPVLPAGPPLGAFWKPFRAGGHRARRVPGGNLPWKSVPFLPRVCSLRLNRLALKPGSGGSLPLCSQSERIQQLPPPACLSLSDPRRWREDVQFARRAQGINEQRCSPWRIIGGAGAARGSAVALLSSPAC